MAEIFTNPRLFDPREQVTGGLFDPPAFTGQRPSVLPLPTRQRSGEREWTAPQWLVDMVGSASGQGPRWSDEIVLEGNESPQDIIAQIKNVTWD